MALPTQLNATEQDTLVKQIGLSLLRAAPSDWRRVTVEYRAVGRYHELTGEVVLADNTTQEWGATHDIANLFGRLRTGMYREGRGTWFNARYQLDHPSSYNLEYDRDEPGWDLIPPPQAYADELRMFPRDEENVPDWLMRRMAGLGPERPGPRFRAARIFDGTDDQGRPVLDRPEPDPGESDRLLAYLDGAPVVVPGRGLDIDRLSPAAESTVPIAFHSDGTWVWPAAVNYYLREYGVCPEPELLDHIRANGYAVPETDEATLQAAAAHITQGAAPQRPGPAPGATPADGDEEATRSRSEQGHPQQAPLPPPPAPQRPAPPHPHEVPASDLPADRGPAAGDPDEAPEEWGRPGPGELTDPNGPADQGGAEEDGPTGPGRDDGRPAAEPDAERTRIATPAVFAGAPRPGIGADAGAVPPPAAESGEFAGAAETTETTETTDTGQDPERGPHPANGYAEPAGPANAAGHTEVDAERTRIAFPVRVEDNRAEADRYEADRFDDDRYEADRYEADRYEADRYEADRYEADRAGADRYEADRYEADRFGIGWDGGPADRDHPDTDRTDSDLPGDPDDPGRGVNGHSGPRPGPGSAGEDAPTRFTPAPVLDDDGPPTTLTPAQPAAVPVSQQRTDEQPLPLAEYDPGHEAAGDGSGRAHLAPTGYVSPGGPVPPGGPVLPGGLVPPEGTVDRGDAVDHAGFLDRAGRPEDDGYGNYTHADGYDDGGPPTEYADGPLVHDDPVLDDLGDRLDELDVPRDAYRIGGSLERGWALEEVSGGWRVGWYDDGLKSPAMFGDVEDAAAFMLGKLLLVPDGSPSPASEDAPGTGGGPVPAQEEAPPQPAGTPRPAPAAQAPGGLPPYSPGGPGAADAARRASAPHAGDGVPEAGPPAQNGRAPASPPSAQSGPPGQADTGRGGRNGKGNQQWPIQPMQGEPPLTLFRGKEMRELPMGSELDRFGGPNGNLTYAAGTPFEERSLVPEWVDRPYHVYRVQRPMQALAGVAIPWFHQPGGGAAYLLPASIEELVADGDLIELEPGEPPVD